jgi:hypothetical protein
MPVVCVEWQFLHEPAVLVFQVAVPVLAAVVDRPLLWHEAPEHVSSLPDVVFFVYVAIDDELLVDTSADPSFWGWPGSYPPVVLWQ